MWNCSNSEDSLERLGPTNELDGTYQASIIVDRYSMIIQNFETNPDTLIEEGQGEFQSTLVIEAGRFKSPFFEGPVNITADSLDFIWEVDNCPELAECLNLFAAKKMPYTFNGNRLTMEWIKPFSEEPFQFNYTDKKNNQLIYSYELIRD